MRHSEGSGIGAWHPRAACRRERSAPLPHAGCWALRGSRRQTCEDLCARQSAATIRSGDVSGRGPLGECAGRDRVCSVVGGVVVVGDGCGGRGGGGRMSARVSVNPLRGAVLLGVGERDDSRGAFEDAVVVPVDSCFGMAYRRMQTAPRWSLALVTLLAWF